jgi:release factor glutamine methyltransferase
MPSLHEQVAEASRALVDAGIPASGARLDAEVLARHVLGWDRAALLARGREPGPDDFGPRFGALIARRAAREPVALIVGHREFWGLEFEVTSDVLIPRPETEFLVEAALAQARHSAVTRLVDVGTGSGCVAVALAVELPSAHVIATDVSAGALAVARRNAERHRVADRVTFVRTDLLAGLAVRTNLIVSNPPYVPSAAVLQPEVGRHEPHQALFGGGDGLAIMRRLLDAAPANLVPGGRLIVEFGDGQEEALRSLCHDAGWRVIEIRDDLQGIARVALLER